MQGRGPDLKIVGHIHRFLALKGGQGSKSGPVYTDFWLRGAECTPSIPNINIDCKNALIKVACAQTRSVPIKRYGILGGRGVGKGNRAQNCWKFTLISGAEALSAPPLYPIIK